MPERMIVDLVILCMQRSGSHLLGTLLGSHPDIKFHFEILDVYRHRRVYERDDQRVNCVIVMYNQIELAASMGISLSETKIIHLVRDETEVAISNIRLNRSKSMNAGAHKPHYERGDVVPEVFAYQPPATEIESMRNYIAFHRELAVAALGKNRDVYRISYECITGGSSVEEVDEMWVGEMCRFVGVSPRPLKTNLVKNVFSGGSGDIAG